MSIMTIQQKKIIGNHHNFFKAIICHKVILIAVAVVDDCCCCSRLSQWPSSSSSNCIVLWITRNFSVFFLNKDVGSCGLKNRDYNRSVRFRNIYWRKKRKEKQNSIRNHIDWLIDLINVIVFRIDTYLIFHSIFITKLIIFWSISI